MKRPVVAFTPYDQATGGRFYTRFYGSFGSASSSASDFFFVSRNRPTLSSAPERSSPRPAREYLSGLPPRSSRTPIDGLLWYSNPPVPPWQLGSAPPVNVSLPSRSTNTAIAVCA